MRREERAEGRNEDGGHTVAEGGVFLRDLEWEDEEEVEDFERRELSLCDLEGVISRWYTTCSCQISSTALLLSSSHARHWMFAADADKLDEVDRAEVSGSVRSSISSKKMEEPLDDDDDAEQLSYPQSSELHVLLLLRSSLSSVAIRRSTVKSSEESSRTRTGFARVALRRLASMVDICCGWSASDMSVNVVGMH